jgi:uncharacterized Zn-binding protein involved in type VI secretion
LDKQKGRPYLFGMPSISESDTIFWARCAGNRAIDIGIGGNNDVGKGKGEAVSITLKSGSVSVKVDGQSRKSENFEMTGTSELRTKVSSGHDVFKVLATGKPIAVSGSMKAETWPVKGLRGKVAAFLKSCK